MTALPDQLRLPAAVPGDLADQIRAVIDPLPAHRREQFELRVERWWADLREPLQDLYSNPDAVAGRALLTAAHGYADRSEDLHTLDARRSLEPDWFERPGMLGYACYAERFAEPGTGLTGVALKADYLHALGVRYLHLMPLLQPRPDPNDGGYAVMDYRKVRDDLGGTEDLRALTTALRHYGISVCIDFVLNHVAEEHEWAVKARAGDAKYRDYFHIFRDRSEPDRYEATLPEVFPENAPGNFTFDKALNAWVWTTFNSYQWDLNWANPDVLIEMADITCYLANLGVEVLRLDAIAFVWKRLGTNCQNQPEVHSITQVLRTIMRIASPAVVFLAEAIVGPDDLVAYLGTGRHYGKVADLAYHNALMVHIWSMLASRDATLAARALGRFPRTPAATSWITYVRCHDDIGWAIDDTDAATAGVSGFGHRNFLSDFYAGDFAGSFADGLVFQYNPLTGDRRISGMTASLAGLEEGLARRDNDEIDLAIKRILLAYAIIMGFGGIPMIWSGDEIGMLNDPHWADDPAHADDNRWAHRPRMDWDEVARLTSYGTDGAFTHDRDAVRAADAAPGARLWVGIRRMASTRANLPQLDAADHSTVLEAPDSGVFAAVQHNPIGALLALHNVSETARFIPAWWIREQGVEPTGMVDHLGIGQIKTDDGVTLGAYQSMWLTSA